MSVSEPSSGPQVPGEGSDASQTPPKPSESQLQALHREVAEHKARMHAAYDLLRAEILAQRAAGVGRRTIARQLGVDWTRVRQIERGQRASRRDEGLPALEEYRAASGAPEPPEW